MFWAQGGMSKLMPCYLWIVLGIPLSHEHYRHSSLAVAWPVDRLFPSGLVWGLFRTERHPTHTTLAPIIVAGVGGLLPSSHGAEVKARSRRTPPRLHPRRFNGPPAAAT